MKKHYKKHLVNFCPLCGSNVVTHIGNNSFVCGTGDSDIESKEKFNFKNSRCNRVFAIIQPISDQHDNTLHRMEIGLKVDQLREGKKDV